MKNYKFLLLILMIFLIASSTIQAAGFERLGVGARAVSMGEAMAAYTANDSSLCYWNPAGISYLDKVLLGYSYMNFFGLDLLYYNYFGFIYPRIDGRDISLGVSLFRVSTSDEVSYIDYTENTFLLTLAYLIDQKISFGLNSKVYLVGYSEMAYNYGFDAGLNYKINDNLKAGLVIYDLTIRKLKWDTGTEETQDPGYRAGIECKLFDDLILTGDIARDNNISELQYFAGGSYLLVRFLRLQAGINYKECLNFATGAGITIPNILIDYSYSMTGRVKLFTHYISMNLMI